MNTKSSGMPILTNGAASDQSVIDWDFEALRLNQSFDQIVGAQTGRASMVSSSPRSIVATADHNPTNQRRGRKLSHITQPENRSLG